MSMNNVPVLSNKARRTCDDFINATLPVLTEQRAIELLEAEVAAEGDSYVYPQREAIEDLGDGTEYQSARCDYVRDERPSCLVGRALHAYGVSIEQLKSIEGTSIGAFGQQFTPVSWLPHSVAGLLYAAQNAQDGGQTWGEALIAAKDMASGVKPNPLDPQPFN
jgi:hypothetical protein